MAEKKSKRSSDDDLLKEAREAFERCADAEKMNRATAKDDIKFAREGIQWPEKVAQQRELEGRPCLTINKMPAFIRQVVNDARQNKPAIKVHPADSGADPETAEVINGLIRNIEYTSNADTAYDTATECAVSGGFGYWRVTADYAYDDSFEMDLRIDRISNPFSVYGDPNSTAADSSDWDVAFVVDRLSKAEYEREYPDAEKVDWDSTEWNDLKSTEWFADESVLVAEWWTREKVDRPILLCQDMRDGKMLTLGKKEFEEDEDLRMMAETGIIQVKQERIAKSCKVTQRIMSGAEILKTTEWKGKYIPIIPVYGDEFDIEGKRYFRSLIHNAIDAQRMVNYWRTTSTELVALAPKVPFVGPKGAFATDIDKWNTANTKSHPFIQYDGQQPPIRLPLDSGPAAGALQEALNASDDMKAIIGLYDASLGARSNETSGVAINARQREGDVSTFHFIDNMARGIRHTGRVLIDLIPHFYNTERVIRVIGEDGSQEAKKVNTQQPVEQEDKKGNVILAMHDLTAGKYDLTVTTGPSFTTRREEAAAQMTEAVRAFPMSAQIILPHLAKNLDWPGADDIAEELDAMKQQQVPPELQKAIEDGKQKIAQLEQENQAMKMDTSVDQKKAQDQSQLAEQKAVADVTLAREKAIAEHELAKQKLANEREIELMKVRNARDIEAMKNDGVEEEGEDGEKTVKSGTEVVLQGLSMLGQLIVQQGEAQARRDEMLMRIAVAENQLIRDPMTGKAAGSRKVLQ